MCKAKKYTEELLNIYQHIEDDLNTYNQEKSELEGLELDILHIIENDNFNAAQGYQLAKMIKDARMRRRDLKHEIEPLVTLKRNFIDQNVNQLKGTLKSVINQDKQLTELKANKVYKPRTLKTTNLKLVVSR